MVGDEAWDVDHFLHENPGRKLFGLRLAHRLRRLAADAGRWCGGGRADHQYDAEMLEQRARWRRLRDRSVFVGNPDDVVA